MKKQRVLFLCTANSARSQMAQVLLRYNAADTFDSYSAGTEPDTVDESTIAALKNLELMFVGKALTVWVYLKGRCLIKFLAHWRTQYSGVNNDRFSIFLSVFE